MTSPPNVSARSADFEFSALDEAKNYRAALLHHFRLHLRGNVLEVGAGIGQITAELRQWPEIQKLFSIEPDAGFCAQLRARFPQHDLLQGTVADLISETAWSAILSINVLEHIELDGPELAAYHRLLKPTCGTLCLFVPARSEIYAPIDRDFGHLRRYNRNELSRKLKLAGFAVTQMRYFNFPGYFAWWLNFCLLKKRSFSSKNVRWFDRIIFPPTNNFESHVCPPPIGQSLIAVAVAR